MHDFLDKLSLHPIIAAIRDERDLPAALYSPAFALFLLGGSLLSLPAMAADARDAGKKVFVHIDLIEGLGTDPAAVNWCAATVSPHGIISTRAPILKRAKSLGLLTIQRLFLVDSASIHHGERQLAASKPDMVEILPGLLPKPLATLRDALGPSVPIIAGGLISSPAEVLCMLDAGAIAISTSAKPLWSLNPDGR